MLAIRKILCPTDLSGTSDRGMDTALAMARQYSAKLFLLYVVNGMSIRQDPAFCKGMRGRGACICERKMMADAYQRLENLAARKVPEDINLGIRVTMGALGREIKQTVEDEYIDAIILSTRGYAGWRRLVSGSLAQWLVAHADCPVIAIPRNAKDRYGNFTFQNNRDFSHRWFHRRRGKL